MGKKSGSITSTELEIPDLHTRPPRGLSRQQLVQWSLAEKVRGDLAESTHSPAQDEKALATTRLLKKGVEIEKLNAETERSGNSTSDTDVARYLQLCAREAGLQLVKLTPRKTPNPHDLMLDIAFQVLGVTRRTAEKIELSTIKESLKCVRLHLTIIAKGNGSTRESITNTVALVRSLLKDARILILADRSVIEQSTFNSLVLEEKTLEEALVAHEATVA